MRKLPRRWLMVVWRLDGAEPCARVLRNYHLTATMRREGLLMVSATYDSRASVTPHAPSGKSHQGAC
jgi:hypothetical protein